MPSKLPLPCLFALPLHAACNIHAPAWYAFPTAETDATSATTETTPGQVELTLDAGSSTVIDTDALEPGTSTSLRPETTDAELPLEILEIELDAKIHAAGPAPLAVSTRNATDVRIELDGQDLGALLETEPARFTGTLPIRGHIDNGPHIVEVIATRGEQEIRREASFAVSTPKPGTLAWFQTGPSGSQTRRVALTAERDLLLVGALEVDGVVRPTISKRSGIDGAELWPEGALVLDACEGTADDLALTPDGHIWVAMNVRDPGKQPQPRMILLDADGHWAGVELLGELGHIVRAVAADADGGFLAVGIATIAGNLDISFWRVDGDLKPQLTGLTWDYVPDPKKKKTFGDVATDLFIQGDRAIIIGTTQGKHVDWEPTMRGMILEVETQTATPLQPPILAPAGDLWKQSMFGSGVPHPEGVLIVGTGCDELCTMQVTELSLFSPGGVRLWHQTDLPASIAFGSDLVVDSQGRALVATNRQDGAHIRGRIVAWRIGQDTPPLFQYLLPDALGPSELLGVVVDDYDRIFGSGYLTAAGTRQARLIRLHP